MSKFDFLLFKILRLSKIFDWFYTRHLTELCFDLENWDLEQKELIKKYRDKLERLGNAL